MVSATDDAHRTPPGGPIAPPTVTDTVDLQLDLTNGAAEIPPDCNLDQHFAVAIWHLNSGEVLEAFNMIKKAVLKFPVDDLKDDNRDVFSNCCQNLLKRHVNFHMHLKSVEIADLPTKPLAVHARKERTVAIKNAGEVISKMIDKFVERFPDDETFVFFEGLRAQCLYLVSKALTDSDQKDLCTKALKHFNSAEEKAELLDYLNWEYMLHLYYHTRFQYACLNDKSGALKRLKQYAGYFKGTNEHKLSKLLDKKGIALLDKIKFKVSKWELLQKGSSSKKARFSI